MWQNEPLEILYTRSAHWLPLQHMTIVTVCGV